jgi:hypothetical protein
VGWEGGGSAASAPVRCRYDINDCRLGADEPIIFAGDLRSPQKILEWLLTRKDPSGISMEEVEGEALQELIQDEGAAVVVYFCEQPVY